MNQMSVLITGISTGLGRAFADYYLQQGAEVYGVSRSGSGITHPRLHEQKADLGKLNRVQTSLAYLLQGVDRLDLVILNAGILGKIEPMHSLGMDRLKHLMDVNVWSNKLLLDYLCESWISIEQVVAISSGAAVNGNKGWGAYSLSKATLNMLVKLYAAEYEATHFTALAPGLVDTRMQDHLCDPDKVNASQFPSVQKLRDSRGTEAMPTPAAAAAKIASIIPALSAQQPSGEFIDIRNL